MDNEKQKELLKDIQMNMKQIFVILLFLSCSLTAHSQWGVKGGLNYSTITDMASTQYMPFGHLGVTYEKRMSNNWFLQPELLFTAVGCDLEDDKITLKGGHINMYALELPVNFSFRPKVSEEINIIVDLGAYTRYGLFGNKTYRYYYDIPTVDGSPFDAFNRFDIGLNFGLGLQKNQYSGVFSLSRGFSHVQKNDAGTYHQVFRLSFGYKF